LRQPKNNTAAHGKRLLVGVLVDGVSRYGRSILRGVLRYANLTRRWQLYEAVWRSSESPLDYWPKCDGAILGGASAEIMHRIRRKCRHVVICSGSADPKLAAVVSLDDLAAGAMAANHLMDCRLEHFAFYGTRRGRHVGGKRLVGFREALAKRNLTCVEAPVGAPTQREWLTHSHRPKLIRWLVTLPKPIGIMAFDDASAHDLAAACLEANIPVPENVAIIGVNNDDLLCESAWPPLTSIEADFSRVGYAAAQHLDIMLRGEELPAESRVVRLPPLGVVQRQSTSVLFVQDANLAQALQFIREHACDPCNVDDVLREVPVGRRWLERQFLRTIGRSPHDEIARVRIEAAKRLLLQPEMKIPEVAERCGLAVMQTFNRAFKTATSMTPAAYRRSSLRGASEKLGTRQN
jgi:LacI family transcriptional regulator